MVEKCEKYKAADIDLEGDWSAAANFLVAGAVFGKVVLHGLDTTLFLVVMAPFNNA